MEGQEKEHAITFLDKVLVTGPKISIGMIYKNIIGINLKGEDHKKYLEFVNQETGMNITNDNLNNIKIIEL